MAVTREHKERVLRHLEGTMQCTFHIGQIVVANSGAVLGLPYRATIEKIEGDRARVRPMHPTLTEGSARGSHTRQGPSVRARWVKLSGLHTLVDDEACRS